MRNGTEKSFQTFCLVFVLLAVIYVGGYLCTVRRSVSTGGWKPMPGGSKEYFSVDADLGGNITRPIFLPALKIDRRYIRKRYWASYYVVVNGGSTNIICHLDMSPEEMRKR